MAGTYFDPCALLGCRCRHCRCLNTYTRWTTDDEHGLVDRNKYVGTGEHCSDWGSRIQSTAVLTAGMRGGGGIAAEPPRALRTDCVDERNIVFQFRFETYRHRLLGNFEQVQIPWTHNWLVPSSPDDHHPWTCSSVCRTGEDVGLGVTVREILV